MMPNRMTGTSPYMIVFGYEPHIPLDEAFELPPLTDVFEEERVVGHLNEYKQGMKPLIQSLDRDL